MGSIGSSHLTFTTRKPFGLIKNIFNFNITDADIFKRTIWGNIDQQTTAHSAGVGTSNIPDATWEIKKGDFEVAAATGNVKFKDKTQLILTEYLAYKDMGSFVILKELTENYMNIAMGIHTEASIIDKPTLLFHMSLEAE